jgi:hypothetical protein
MLQNNGIPYTPTLKNACVRTQVIVSFNIIISNFIFCTTTMIFAPVVYELHSDYLGQLRVIM